MSEKNIIDMPSFHPSFFETTQKDLPEDDRTLMEKTSLLNKNLISELSSADKYSLTVDDEMLSESNTKYIFRNLYGETLLTSLFFSKTNIENIQKVIRFIVFKETKYVIDNQSINELLIIMRSIFLEYSAHPKLIDEKMSTDEKNMLLTQYRNEVKRLNEIVINTVVPKIVSQMLQYINYLNDASQAPQYMDRPKNESVSGQRQYRSITEVLTGSDL